MTSLRRHLLAWLLGALIVAGGIASFATYRTAREDVNELFDYQLQQLAFSLRHQRFLQDAVAPGYDPDNTDFITQIWDASGVLIHYSNRNVDLPFPQETGFSDVTWNNRQWRVYTTVYRNHTIQVAHPLSLRREVADDISRRALLPLLALLPVLALLIWITVGRALRPLERVSTQLRSRTPSALEPLPLQPLPREVRPLVTALNDLLGRLDHALETQRQFTADAAHELRTPLTAVQLQIQLVERAATDAGRSAALVALKQGVQRSAHLVQQLLTLARLEPADAAAQPFTIVALDALAREVIAEHAPVAHAKNVDLGLAHADPVAVTGDHAGLHTLLGNLVDNALRYTPAGGSVDVSIRAGDGSAAIEVSDTGCGIPPEDRDRVFDRFYRRLGDDTPGSGLGLAIVKRIAERHHATIKLADGDRGTGLRVTVRMAASAR